MNVLGVDIGGSEIKAAPIDTASGGILSQVSRMATPASSTPDQICAVVSELVEGFSWTGPIGCTFPGPIVDASVQDPGFLHESWAGCDIEARLLEATARPVTVLNDADAAGLAEVHLGGSGLQAGTVLVLTFGTGIGSALFVDGHLVPNTEFGTLLMEEGVAEEHASARIRSTEQLSDEAWVSRVSTYLNYVGSLVYPARIVLGGGISSRWSEFSRMLNVDFHVQPATFVGDAGIVGAALSASGVLAQFEWSPAHVP